MKNIKKVLALIIVLLSPIIIFLFLKQYGNNQFELPIYYPDGNPLSQCGNNEKGQHKVNFGYTGVNNLSLPAIFTIAGAGKNDYYSDLANVLAKYPEIGVWEIYVNDSSVKEDASFLNLDDEAFLKFVNCELVLGEDKWLAEGMPFKYVLVDKEARIRSYLDCTNLKEIERLDTELDILLNY